MHISEHADFLRKEDPKKLEKQFSKYITLGIEPASIPKMFDDVRNNILAMEE